MKIPIPVRPGPYLYVVVHPDGSTENIDTPDETLDAGSIEVEVDDSDRVMELARSSTSDPDLAPARGQLWPEES